MKKKLAVLIGLLIITFIIFLIFYFKSHSYELEYSIDDVLVKESYNNKDKYYIFTFKYNDLDYSIISIDKYTNKRKLIEKIDIINEDNLVCLKVDKAKVSVYSICYSDGEYKLLTSNELATFNENDSYENILIDNLNSKTYLLWNYQNFIYLKDNKKDKLDLFDKDIYNLNLYYAFDNTLVLPDYNATYQFNKVYIVNVDNLKVTSFKLRFEVYFDSYFLGNDKQNVYLYDNKSEQEYYLDLKKSDINKTGYKILVNGNWENVTNQKLKNNKLAFYNATLTDYILEDDKLYMVFNDTLVKVTDRSVSKIISTDTLGVYYLAKDTLYYSSITGNEIALLKYSEWEFNNQNMIFIF